MPSLGPAEILVVLVIALLVFGPDKMPQMARQAGKAFSEFRRVQQHLRSEISGAMSDLGGSGADTPAADAPGSDIGSSAQPPGGDPVPMLPSKDPDAPQADLRQPDARQPDAQPPPPGATGSSPDASSSSASPSAPDLGSGPDPVDPA